MKNTCPFNPEVCRHGSSSALICHLQVSCMLVLPAAQLDGLAVHVGPELDLRLMPMQQTHEQKQAFLPPSGMRIGRNASHYY